MITLKKSSFKYKDENGNMQDAGVLVEKQTDITATETIGGVIRISYGKIELLDDNGHDPIGISSIEEFDNETIRIHYDKNYSKVGFLNFTPTGLSDTFGYKIWASVGTGYSDIKFGQQLMCGGFIDVTNSVVSVLEDFSGFNTTATWDNSAKAFDIKINGLYACKYPIACSLESGRSNIIPMSSYASKNRILVYLYNPDGTQITSLPQNYSLKVALMYSSKYIKLNDLKNIDANQESCNIFFGGSMHR